MEDHLEFVNFPIFLVTLENLGGILNSFNKYASADAVSVLPAVEEQNLSGPLVAVKVVKGLLDHAAMVTLLSVLGILFNRCGLWSKGPVLP
jgi:hypothetical protein